MRRREHFLPTVVASPPTLRMIALILAGCVHRTHELQSPPPDSDPRVPRWIRRCVDDHDCASDYVCISGGCVHGNCHSDADCPPRSRCSGYSCSRDPTQPPRRSSRPRPRPPALVGQRCGMNHCAEGLRCDGVCRTLCNGQDCCGGVRCLESETCAGDTNECAPLAPPNVGTRPMVHTRVDSAPQNADGRLVSMMAVHCDGGRVIYNLQNRRRARVYFRMPVADGGVQCSRFVAVASASRRDVMLTINPGPNQISEPGSSADGIATREIPMPSNPNQAIGVTAVTGDDASVRLFICCMP